MQQVHAVIDVSDATFDHDVLQRSHDVPVVVDFWAPWCGPCRMLGPILERIAGEPDAGFVLAKLNVDDNQSLAAGYGVRGIPAVKAFRAGKVVDEFVGALPEPQVRAFIERVAPSKRLAQLATANQLLADMRWEDAEACFREILEQPEAKLGRAKALLGQGRGCAAAAELASIEDLALLAHVEKLQPLADFLCSAESTPISTNGEDPLAAQYDRAAKLMGAGDIPAALDELLSVLCTDKTYDEGLAKNAVLGAFALLGDEHPLTQQYRPKLAMLLF